MPIYVYKSLELKWISSLASLRVQSFFLLSVAIDIVLITACKSVMHDNEMQISSRSSTRESWMKLFQRLMNDNKRTYTHRETERQSHRYTRTRCWFIPFNFILRAQQNWNFVLRMKKNCKFFAWFLHISNHRHQTNEYFMIVILKRFHAKKTSDVRKKFSPQKNEIFKFLISPKRLNK